MEIEINGINKNYRKKQVLKDISFRAEGGQCVGILGANGSGKSTLLSILAGVLQPDSGDFLFNGESLFSNAKKRSQIIGYVPQGTPLIEELSAKDNLRLWYNSDDLKKELESGVLKMLGIPDFLKVSVSKMSGGMKKRLSIGCAMAKRPPIMLLDEPTAALDLVCKESISEYLKTYKKSGGLLILTTHDLAEVELCDRCFIIKDGSLVPFVYDGNVKKLIESL